MTNAPIDDVLELLANPHRRLVCADLLATGGTTVDDLAASIVDDRSAESSAEARRRARIDLVHVHLPKLAEYGVVEYDPRNGDVVSSTGLDRIGSVLNELPVEATDEWSDGETAHTV